MDDLKHKFLSLLNRHDSLSKGDQSESNNVDVTSLIVNQRRNVTRERIVKQDPVEDEQILAQMEQHFLQQDFDPSGYELNNLGEAIDCADLEVKLSTRERQHSVVSKKVLQLISQQQDLCSQHFEKVVELQNELQTALEVCKDGRAQLNTAKKQLTVTSLGILANHRKRTTVLGLLSSLNTINTLQRTEERLQELLSEGNYPGAIQLLLECQSAASTFRHFTCVAALSGKLQDTLVMVEETLDVALGKVCGCFDHKNYSQLQEAYKLLGKTKPAMDQLHMHFTSAIHDAALGVVQSYSNNITSKQYNEICKNISTEHFIASLTDLCKALWHIMKSYYEVMRWHQLSKASESNDLEENLDKQYIDQKLEAGLARVWHDVQARVCIFMISSDLASYKFDDFLQVLSIVHRLMEVGEEFCGSKSEDLQNSIREKSLIYFRGYHHARLDELRVFFENESWELCPVRTGFTVLQLQEFRYLKGVLKNWRTHNSPDCNSSIHSHDGSSIAGGFFSRYAESGTPFDITLDESQDEDILANLNDEPSGYFSEDSDDDIPDELKRDFVDESVEEKPSKPIVRKRNRKELLNAPIVTNTSLSVLRQCGKYIEMSRLLRSIAKEVILSLTQLYEYYLFAVHSFFAIDLHKSNPFNSIPSPFTLKLQTSVEKIRENLILPSIDYSSESLTSIYKDKVAKPMMSPTVDINSKATLFGLPERVVAVESLIYLSQQFEFLQDYLEYLGSCEQLQYFFSHVISCALDLRRPVYVSVSRQLLDYQMFVSLMDKVKWDIKEVSSEHSPYVDSLLKELQMFASRLQEISSLLPIPVEVYQIMWTDIVYITNDLFVEGFSNARRCSNGGRALMQLDFTQFCSKLKKLTDVRSLPNTNFVDQYVKAYYLPEAALETFIREHTEYSTKQLESLVNCTSSTKKPKQKLSMLIDDLKRLGR